MVMSVSNNTSCRCSMSRGACLLFAVLAILSSAGLPGMVSAQRDSGAPLELDNRGYVNLLIGISERVPEDLAVLDRLQFVITEASKFLFQATKNQAYFKDVHILVPESWSDSEDYADVEWERYDQSDLIIDVPSESNGNRPYVRKPTPCGVQGHFIHLTPDYILSQSIASRYGPYDKTFVHEWAHYRWGVFDEYPLPSGQHFYADAEGNIEAVRCVLNIQGRRVNPTESYGPCDVDNNGLPEADCRFLDDRVGTGYTGSLMYKQFLSQVSTFCEENANGVSQGNVHNREAPNLQNIQCQGKSIWEVMLKHRDFAAMKGENDVNRREFDGEPVPKFTIVKKRSSRLVLVLDSSGSMRGQRLIQLRQAAELLINQILEDGEQLGVVEFNKVASIKSYLLDINDANRQTLLNSIPIVANGATSIGSGIVAGLDVLKERSDRTPPSAAGGKLLVITDGRENEGPLIKDILPLVNNSGVTVDTIAIGMSASPDLELLSSVTGGTTYYHDDLTNSLSDAFGKSSTTDKGITSTPVTLSQDFVQIPPNQNFTGAVFVDDTIGRNTQFLYGHGVSGSITVRVTDPSGAVLTVGSPGYNVIVDFRQIRITIAGNAEVGLWKFVIINKLPSVETVTILVQSHARGGKDPIAVKSRWGYAAVVPPQQQSLYVAVGQGYTPVVGGEVKATVELPCGSGNETVALHPKDDGTGADIIKDDGIYSAFFTEFCSEGRYGVIVEVNNKGRATAIASGSIVGVGAAVNIEYTGDGGEYQSAPTLRSTGDFRRVTIGGSFKCEGSQLCNGSIDMYPPSRITDLLASHVNVDTMQVTLTFTAPGDDLTTGKASRYFIVMSRKVADIFDNFEAVPEIPLDSYVQGDVMVPKNSGEPEVFVVRVPEIGHFSYSFAVVAEDDEGNRGDPSNVATSSARIFSKTPIGLIVGVAAGGAVLLILIVVLLSFLICRKRKEDSPPPENTPRINNNAPGRQIDPDPVYVNVGAGNTPSGQAVGGVKDHRAAPSKAVLQPDAVYGQHAGGGLIIKGQQARTASGPPAGTVNPGFETSWQDSSPVYTDFITRRERDPNWDPTQPNNREGGGANIQTGHVANAKAMFDNVGLLK